MGRLGLSDVTPSVLSGEFPARAVVGEQVPVAATVFREGHDAVGATVLWTSPPLLSPAAGGSRVNLDENSVGQAEGVSAENSVTTLTRMTPGVPGTDRWHATVSPDRPGMWSFVVEAWSDPIGTWLHALTVKLAAGQDAADLTNELETGARLLERVVTTLPVQDRALLRFAITSLRDESLPVTTRCAAALGDDVMALLEANPIRELITRSACFEVWVDRQRALYGAWYELFPRSIGAELSSDPATPSKPVRHGTFLDATKHLDYVADMKFDVVYLLPIHPIGQVNRKGANNALDAAPWDVGSPYAIGSAEGGHDAIHPQLGTVEDFRAFVARARELDMEVALDLALSCAPDHPWVTEHPEWFTTLPDGTIAYAENPPKKYQDIYPLNFDNDPTGIYAECLRIVKYWVDLGVKIFRVDNPHTKPVNFWNWLIWEVKKTDPDVLFLAEAFTRPAMMHALAMAGFTQSYTYFTWRTTKQEITDYANDLIATAHYMRPNFFPTTHDILPAYLQTGGPAAFTIRAVLAATLSPAYGIYSGYELFEHIPVRPGSEEFLNSEKYQLRPRDLPGARDAGTSLSPLLTRINEIRRAHPALQQLRELRFHHADNDQLLIFSKQDPATSDTILVVISLDPWNAQEGTVALDLPALGVERNTSFTVRDQLRGDTYQWGQRNYVRMTPAHPAHILNLEV